MPTHDQTRDFVRSFAAHEHEIYRYILALLPDTTQAQDVFQDTAVTLWEKIDTYDPARPFVAWALGIAHLKVLSHRKKFARQPHLLSDATLQLVADQYDAERDQLETQMAALQDCLAQLKPHERALLAARYDAVAPIADYAARTGKAVNTLYKSLDRLRRRLLECVQHRLGTEGSR
ncbi:MAG: sigma-70 family RNA polymerase sigma factor [Planctomycetes bacterium]|nr:sigma-70 family RNA polymerase sigma factor [Planctomycetota bacterium]